MLPGQNPCGSPDAMLLGELPSPSSLAGLGTVWGAGVAAGGKPSIHTAQRIACSLGLMAEPMLRGGNGGTAPSHCNLPSEGGRNLALLTRTGGFNKASALVLGLRAAHGTCCL